LKMESLITQLSAKKSPKIGVHMHQDNTKQLTDNFKRRCTSLVNKAQREFEEITPRRESESVSPTRKEMKEQLKYGISPQWKKPFRVEDLIPSNLVMETSINEQLGKANAAHNRKIYFSKIVLHKMSRSFHGSPPLQTGKRSYRNPEYTDKLSIHFDSYYKSKDIPLSNRFIKDSLSKPGSPRFTERFRRSKTFHNSSDSNIKISPFTAADQKEENTIYEKKNENFRSITFDAKRQAEKSFQVEKETQYFQSKDDAPLELPYPKLVPYDISEYEHLFLGNEIPEEFRQIYDPLQFHLLISHLKKEFNDNTHSEFLNCTRLKLPYQSRRDEVGGNINQPQWETFMDRLRGLIDKIRRKRRNIIKKRKKKGNKKLPRKTNMKPIVRPNMENNSLWKEVFLGEVEREREELKLPPIKKGTSNSVKSYNLL